MGKIYFITGGISSGKSKFAEDLCTNLEDNSSDSKVVYLATSIPFDDEMKQKRDNHIERRKLKKWHTIEAYIDISEALDRYFFDMERKSFSENKIVLLDCVTMMISNIIFESDKNFDAGNLDLCKEKSNLINIEFDKLINYVRKNDIDLILVANEVGLGGISQNRLSRYFANLNGEINQKLSKISDSAYLVVSGIPIKIK